MKNKIMHHLIGITGTMAFAGLTGYCVFGAVGLTIAFAKWRKKMNEIEEGMKEKSK